MWAYETTFYQIYPLGFCGAPRENAAPVAEDELAQAANAAPNPDAPIMKIAQWAGYLQELGIGAVLINPPLESDSHGYDTRSLRHIDRRLGGDADFAAVCETLHAHGIRVVLDAVFNHVGRVFGPSAMFRSASGTRPTRTGSALALTATPAMATAFGTRAGKVILSL
jgi:cyclomaltodextrinase